MTKVLSVASECAPLIKTGGLADVAGALPAALVPQGVEMRTLLPGYRAVMGALGADAKEVHADPDLFGGSGRVLHGSAGGLDLYVLDAPHLFDRGSGPYLGPDGLDWPDNAVRFAALCWTSAMIAARGAAGWQPDVVHAHDWQAGFVPVHVEALAGPRAVGTVLTIHNIAFQGIAAASMLNTLRLPSSGFTSGGFEYYGHISALKAGMLWSDRVTTVSPTYARELMTAEFGMGLDGVARARGPALSGILNGIDTEVWDPRSDTAIEATYSTPRGKQRNKAALRAEMSLPDADGPVCVLVSRLTEQKGIDALIAAAPALLQNGGQLVVLGSGDPRLEDGLRRLASRSENVAVRIGYDEGMSHRLMAGGDAILVPSRFEPCGLTQMYGLRYGTIPLVARTGGLADTVIDASPAALRSEVATGVQIAPLTAETLADGLVRLCDLYGRPDAWAKMQRNAMAQDVSWSASAEEYAALYKAVAKPG